MRHDRTWQQADYGEQRGGEKSKIKPRLGAWFTGWKVTLSLDKEKAEKERRGRDKIYRLGPTEIETTRKHPDWKCQTYSARLDGGREGFLWYRGRVSIRAGFKPI